jgi:hypothetical protein
MSYLETLEPIRQLQQGCDHFDVKTIDGEITIREFITGMLTYSPSWMKALYGIRWGFVRLLGMTQDTMPLPQFTPETLPFTSGEWATFFQVTAAEENHYWIASATDKHLTAYIAVAAKRVDGITRFDVGTIVHYKNWAGPVYFNVIRPFHHIVVSSMMHAGIQYQRTALPLHA